VFRGFFGRGETPAKTLFGFAIRITAKLAAYTHAFYYVDRRLGSPQGRIKDLWA